MAEARQGGGVSDQQLKRRRYSVYQRITLAAQASGGLRLSRHDVMVLSSDDGVQTLAENDDEDPSFRTRPEE